MAQVVGALGQRGGGLGFRQRRLAGFLLRARVDGVGEKVTGFAAEQAAVGGDVLFAEVVAQQPGERG